MRGKFARRLAFAGVVLGATAGLGGYGLLRASLPGVQGSYRLPGLGAAVAVELDGKGIPAITAQSREDAYFALGFVTARDRLFQMDLLRRQMAGRLAEILGPALLESDRRHRTLGFESVAGEVLKRLPESQSRVLAAYAAGVNRALENLAVPPFEFLLLAYRPEPWRPEDSLLSVLGMEEDLGWTGDSERNATIMEAALPAAVKAFLSPLLDRYTHRLLHGQGSKFGPLPIPKDELSALLGKFPRHYSGVVKEARPPKGSNGWVVGPAKTWDGRAILANDMHLGLRLPTLWYRAELRYAGMRQQGVTLPGIPLVVAGSNGRVAWGFTNIEGDFVDLVAVDLDPADPRRYRGPAGWTRFGERTETIRVRGQADDRLEVRTTVWGPLLSPPLLGKPVAVHWTALDPAATDLKLLDLDAAQDLPAAQAVFNQAGGPPLNALAVDSQGNIGWTYTGRIPRRFGLDGSVSRSWADGSRGWNGYIPPEELPRRVNPPEGFIVNANQRMLDDGYPHVIGHDFDHGHRAYRISERLAGARNLNEREMLALQLDTRAEFYRFYQRLALSLVADDCEGTAVCWRRALENWDGSAEPESSGFALLVEFRRLLLDAVLSPYLAACRALDTEFRFDQATMDEPLQRLLEIQPPELLPGKERYRDWTAFLRDLLIQAERTLSAKTETPEPPAWGALNRVAISHPFSAFLPLLGNFLDLPRYPVPGCTECVRVYTPGQPAYGASERMVVSPGHDGNGLLHLPGGQSGHPLSSHYDDQFPAWLEGKPLPFTAGRPIARLDLIPVDQGREP